MRAMMLERPGADLVLREVETPEPGREQIRLRIEACGVCRTDLHIRDGDLTGPSLPLIPGHEIVGRIDATGPGVTGWKAGQRVGVPWLGHTCGACDYCRAERQNLCDAPEFTGYTRNGGYAEYCVADAGFVFPLDEAADPVALAPLLCAGLIGYRTLKLAGPARRIGIYGFGAAAHIICQFCVRQGQEVFAFTRPGDTADMPWIGRTKPWPICGAAACWARPSWCPETASRDVRCRTGRAVPGAPSGLSRSGMSGHAPRP